MKADILKAIFKNLRYALHRDISLRLNSSQICSNGLLQNLMMFAWQPKLKFATLTTMFKIFGKPDPKEQARKSRSELRSVERDIGRELTKLQREEAKIIQEMKSAAAQGNVSTAKILAKQLVTLRKAKDQQLRAKTQITGVQHRVTQVAAQQTVSSSIRTATKAFATANKATDLTRIRQDVQGFQRESAKLGVVEDALGEGLDDVRMGCGGALFDEEDEEESTRVMNELYDEIGLDVSSKLGTNSIPSALPNVGQASRVRQQSQEDLEAEEELRRLGIGV
ncbi:Snf7-domain-containing protein [Gonapodya prolifera JEL478]|uniref:Snf7-domain-containing protein n=1 Tax=Gonapodya prolifera (strain JEL478) TaxID=1344416 RepID=A0A139AQ32_GONPJ|nr:Snf7-domain-containing protein [Gonapodya prolifera JEL478]|eukprot:KXS18595.1 Snf7-domain-containing protein [Gonapodya prolifera JEL478]